MKQKLVLLGMNQPISGAEPLDPRLPGSAGRNLWSMLREITGCSVEEYMEHFERRNVIDGLKWDPIAAREGAQVTLEALAGRYVVALGGATAIALRLPGSPLMFMAPQPWRFGPFGVNFTLAPHPSGLCRTYNNPVVRKAMGQFLASHW